MKRRKIGIVFWRIIIAVGICIGMYPLISRVWQESRQQRLIEQYLRGEMPSERQLQGKEMLGVLWIPKVKCQLPIFRGTAETVLEEGAGLLEGSSEIGKETCVHTVLCAHSGLPRMYAFAEDAIKARVQGSISRGKVDVFVTLDNAGDLAPKAGGTVRAKAECETKFTELLLAQGASVERKGVVEKAYVARKENSGSGNQGGNTQNPGDNGELG